MLRRVSGLFVFLLLPAVLFFPRGVLSQSMHRGHDPVVVKGVSFKQMLGEDPARLRLFAYNKGRGMIPIPYQIDERMDVSVYKSWTSRREISTYVFDVAEKIRRDPDPSFDRDDEIVFMAGDAGQMAHADAIPRSARACEEIEIEDPETGRQSYAYLCSFEEPPSAPDTGYVYMDETRKEYFSDSYRIGYPEDNPMVFERLQISGNRGESPDILDTFKMSIDLYAMVGTVVYDLTDEDYSHYLRGIRTGPIRIIKEVETVLETWFNAQVRVINRVIYYPDHVELTIMSRTAVYWGDINDADYSLTLDLNRSAEGMKFYSDRNPEGVVIDGVLDIEELNMDYGPVQWTAVSGAYGTVYSHLALPSQQGLEEEKLILPDLYYADADYKADPPENERGMFGKSGFIVRHLQRTGPKPEPFRLVYFFDKEPYAPGAETPYISMYKKPLKVKVNGNMALGLQASAPQAEDIRKDEELPGPTLAPERETVSAARFFAPSFMFDPYYLGNGIGISYSDLDFLGTGVFLGLLTLTSDRNFHWYMIDFQKLRFVPFVEDFRVFLQFQQFPSESFYGLGNDSPEDDQTLYWWKRYEAFVTFRKHFADHYGINTQIFYSDVQIDPGQKARGIESAPSYEEHFGMDEDIIDNDRWGGPLYGMDGGMSNGIAVGFYRDFRDDYQCPHRGNYQEIKLQRVGPEMGSDYNYMKVWLDVRGYMEPEWLNPLFFDSWVSSRRTFLNKFIGPLKHRSLAGKLLLGRTISEEIEYEGQEILDVPFYELMKMGGSHSNRGFYSSRFRDNDIALVSLEYRWVYWRFTDMALFYDVGIVMDDMFDSESWETKYHQGYGMSIRMHIPPGVIATFEYGFSEEMPGGWLLQANWVF